MVKFKFLIHTPYEDHYNTHYAKDAQRAKDKVTQWNNEFRDIDYGVSLVSITKTSEQLPEGYTCW